MQVATLAADGTLSMVASLGDTVDLALDGAQALRTFAIGATQFLVVAGRSDNGISLFSLSDTMPYLTETDTVFDTENAAFEMDGTDDVEVVQVGGNTFLYVSGGFDDGISVFSVSAAGVLSNVENIADDATLFLDGPLGLHGFELDGTHYLVANGVFDQGLSVFSVDPATGALTNVVNVSIDVGNGSAYIYGMDSVRIGDSQFVYVPDYEGDSIAIFRFDGSLFSLIQRITLPDRLEGASDVSIFEVGGRTFLSLAMFDGDSLEFFEIDTDPFSPNQGQLTPVQIIEDDTGQGELEAASYVETVVIGGTPLGSLPAGGGIVR